MFTEIYDISYPLSVESIVFPGDPRFKLNSVATISDKGYAMSTVEMGTHLGTHIDPPAHIISGRETIDVISLEKFIGDCYVIEVRDNDKIGPESLSQHKVRPGEMILFKTRNSTLMHLKEFREDYVYITPEMAEHLVDSKAKLVGLDYFTIDHIKDETFKAHNILLDKGIPILEGIDLSKIGPGKYTLICFPLKIVGGDGSPVRAVLLR